MRVELALAVALACGCTTRALYRVDRRLFEGEPAVAGEV